MNISPRGFIYPAVRSFMHDANEGAFSYFLLLRRLEMTGAHFHMHGSFSFLPPFTLSLHLKRKSDILDFSPRSSNHLAAAAG